MRCKDFGIEVGVRIILKIHSRQPLVLFCARIRTLENRIGLIPFSRPDEDEIRKVRRAFDHFFEISTIISTINEYYLILMRMTTQEYCLLLVHHRVILILVHRHSQLKHHTNTRSSPKEVNSRLQDQRGLTSFASSSPVPCH